MSELYVLDTNVVSELMRATPAPEVLRWFEAVSMDEQSGQKILATSAVSLAEIYAGLGAVPTGKHKSTMVVLVQDILQSILGNRVLALDAQAAVGLDEIYSNRKKAGLPISFSDACIAAICKQHKATIVTRDTSGFVKTGIKIINPWDNK